MYYKSVRENYENEKDTSYPTLRTVKWIIVILLVLLITILNFNRSLDRSMGYRMGCGYSK